MFKHGFFILSLQISYEIDVFIFNIWAVISKLRHTRKCNYRTILQEVHNIGFEVTLKRWDREIKKTSTQRTKSIYFQVHCVYTFFFLRHVFTNFFLSALQENLNYGKRMSLTMSRAFISKKNPVSALTLYRPPIQIISPAVV